MWGIDLKPADLAHVAGMSCALLQDGSFNPEDLVWVAGEIWEEHQPALEAFEACGSQWRWLPRPDGSLCATGLDYTACDAGLRLAGIETTPELWEELQIIELAARAALNEA